MGCVYCCLRNYNLGEEEQNCSFFQIFRKKKEKAVSNSSEQVNAAHNTSNSLSNNVPSGCQPQRQDVNFQLEHAKGPTVPSDEQGRAALPLSNNEPRDFEQERQNDGLVLGHAETLAGPQNSILNRCGNGSADGEELKACLSWNSKNQPSAETTARGTDLYPTSQEEDVCPICFEDYTTENPKTTLLCDHQFHLCCLYEWMERSYACPFCSKVGIRYWNDPSLLGFHISREG